jgi:hypothetical protein
MRVCVELGTLSGYHPRCPATHSKRARGVAIVDIRELRKELCRGAEGTGGRYSWQVQLAGKTVDVIYTSL